MGALRRAPDRRLSPRSGIGGVTANSAARSSPRAAFVCWRAARQRSDCEALAAKSTLNRLEHTPRRHAAKHHKIDRDGRGLMDCWSSLFLETHDRAPREIVLDLDNTDIPLHGGQEGRFFHGYYDEFCYLPLYVFCGRHLLLARQRRANAAGSDGAVEEMARIIA
jgi:hypothetical protein